ncbi:hypothetical protein Pla100_58330 [Neorhodopirellula pilleata]|uniref:Uncharacterized protein n=1 Tax=Neorhodopirellula pilleata TaxID=2714738 RepID=A0A5C5ZKB2_9BACT|nr:hypothetical protein Pla100_58330 [Neorhodopirellula pilleata]
MKSGDMASSCLAVAIANACSASSICLASLLGLAFERNDRVHVGAQLLTPSQ